MKLKMDFSLMAVVAVLTELANRSEITGDESDQPDKVILATPVTNHHFGGVHYFSKVHRRFAWVRPAVNEAGEVAQDRLIVAFGYADTPEAWQKMQNGMMHTFVHDEVQAANVIVSFILDDSYPQLLMSGDYPFFEPELKYG
jgi:hypothetical protein